MHHGKDMEQIYFPGNGIKLIDLKREIVDKKKFNAVLDFELQITDESKKGKCLPYCIVARALLLFLEYTDDNEVVPKNSSLIVKRIAAKNSKAGLLARLSGRNSHFAAEK